MPFVAGITLISLSSDHPALVEVLSSEDGNYAHSFQEPVLDPFNLTSTFEQIASSSPEKIEHAALSLPAFLSKEERKIISRLAQTVFGSTNIPTFSNMQIVHNMFNDVPYSAQNELVIEIGPEVATAELVSTEVEDGIRFKEIEKQIVIRDFDAVDLVARLVDPALTELEKIIAQAGSRPSSSYIDVQDPCLKRVVIIDSSPELVSSLVKQLEAKFQHNSPPVEILVEKCLPRSVAKIALDSHPELSSLASIVDRGGCVFNVAPLRVGIVKADGFVLTLLRRNSTLPQQAAIMLTTSQDNQTTATIQVVVGLSPKATDNTIIAELTLEDISPNLKGVSRLRISLDVEHLGKTYILVEEVVADGLVTGSTTSVTLSDVMGDEMGVKDMDDVFNKGWGEEELHIKAQELEDLWAGEEVQGDLPE